MKRYDIKKAIFKLIPSEETEKSISEKIFQKRHSKLSLKYTASLTAAGFILVVFLGLIGHNFLDKKFNTTPNTISSSEGINIPKLELPKETNTNSKMDMIGLIVYKGRIYTQTGTNIDSKSAEKLLGEKLGTTKGNIDEWSKQSDYAVEFASTIGIQDVYAVKGYDKNFRIMTYTIIDGTIYPQFFDCFNGITVKNGDDFFSKLKIEDNIKAAKYEKFESWNNSKQQYTELENLDRILNFAKELKYTNPQTRESLNHLWDEAGNDKQKFVYITLNDGCEVQLRLFKDGYIFYGFSDVFFKMENEAFNKLWNELK